jgi:hypothetical protein
MFNLSYIYVKPTIYFNIPTNNYSYTHRTTTVNAERINRNINWSVSVIFFESKSNRGNRFVQMGSSGIGRTLSTPRIHRCTSPLLNLYL